MVAVRKTKENVMLNLNRVELLGNVAQAAEVRTLGDGKKVCNLRLATNETWKDRETGERQQRAQFHQLTIWNDKTIDFVQQYVRKGDFLYVQAKLEYTSSGEGDDKRYFTNIVVKRIDFAQPKSAANSDAGQPNGAGQLDDDIPF